MKETNKIKSYFIYSDGIEASAHLQRNVRIYCEYGEQNVNILKKAGFTNIIQLRHKKRSTPLSKNIYFSTITQMPVFDPEKYNIIIIAGPRTQIKNLLGKFPRQQELADYLKVNKATVSGYPKNKKDLMLHGLWIKKILEK